MINHNQNPFLQSFFYCFCLFGEFTKVFERQIWVTHLHSTARALSSPSRCFQLSTNLDKDLFGYFFRWNARTIFTNVKRLLDSLWRRANTRKVSFQISLRWLIYIVNSVDKTKLSINICVSFTWWNFTLRK